ncbi:MAG: hypothetical protein R2828_34145 [Saprospiraceae bacterium]
MTDFRKNIIVIILAILIGCGIENNIYNLTETMTEIENLISQIIETDSIEKHYPDYVIVSILPKYVNRDEKEEFKPGPPPNADYLFPNLEYEFKELSQIEFTSKDFEYFEKQELDSKRIELSNEIFGSRKSKVNIETKKPYVYFSIPIFNSEKDIAWIQTGLVCGSLCGEGRTLILQKKNGKWMKLKEKRDWIS